MRGPKGGKGQGVWNTPLKNHKNIGFLSNTCPDPLKTPKATKPDSMLGHHRHASETRFKWLIVGGPMMAHLWWHLDPLSPLQLKKKVFRVGHPLIKLSESVHG